MSADPDAIVFYGYDLDTMIDPDDFCETLAPAWLAPDDDTEAEETDEHLARVLGWVEIPFPSGAPGYEDFQAHGRSWSEVNQLRQAAEEAWRRTPEYRAWSASQDEKRRIVTESGLGVRFETYGGSEAEETYLLGIEESVQTIPDWGCAPIDVRQMYAMLPSASVNGWHDRLNRYIDLMELTRAVEKREPSWHVAVRYG